MTKEQSQGEDLQPIEDIDRAIHAPARMKILAFLSVVESADFTFLMTQTELSRGNLSSHLKKLEEAGYISVEKSFVERIPRTLITLSTEGRSAIQTYRKNMKTVLDELLGAG